MTISAGWKSIFAIGQNTSHINDVSESESKQLMKWFLKLIAENHDLQVRMRWQNENDVGKSYCNLLSRVLKTLLANPYSFACSYLGQPQCLSFCNVRLPGLEDWSAGGKLG